ncbi:MAG: DUF1446 domain-containing protein [Nitrospirae bacterium]|nr:DUF1446 domain-containing protein [Nitrospirota bacterium]
MTEKLIVANCSGFYGDRLSAGREMVRGGPIDVLTGDYLAELTMAILYRNKMKDPKTGYATTFLRQMEEIIGECLNRGIRVVSNAGGLNPKGMAEALEGIASKLGLRPRIAYIDGDDLVGRLGELQSAGEPLAHMDKGIPLSQAQGTVVTANAYLGGWGIADALGRGADIVVSGRVADASLAVGPAAWRFNWKTDDWDRLAGAVVAGHIIECGPQATGGNYPFFEEVPSLENIGFPIAEMHEDGSCVITKHPGTGGAVTVGTVTSQLLYEIGGPAYMNPDVVARFDMVSLLQEGEDRVLVRGARGEAAPATAKVCLHLLSGARNAMTVVLCGLDIERKYETVKAALLKALGGEGAFDRIEIRLARADRENPRTNEEAWAFMQVAVWSRDGERVGRRFSSKVIEIAMETVPGASFLNPPGDGVPAIVYWPALVKADRVLQMVHLDGETRTIASATAGGEGAKLPLAAPLPARPMAGRTRRVRLGRIFGARSGDKGGHANLGVWGRTEEAFEFLRDYLIAGRLKELLPETAAFEIERHEFPNLLALNFFIRGILQDGAAASTRWDPQAKTLAEYFRAKVVEVPEALLDRSGRE